MELQLSKEMENKIFEAYKAYMEDYPVRKKEVDEFIDKLDKDASICMQFLYAFMAPNDILTYKAEVIYHYVEASLKMRKAISYASEVPVDIFLSYVLPYRVNNENVDESREKMYEEIAPRLNGKTMYDAALEVNYWCYEKATYIPSDERTIAPSTMCKTARGRCGEESTLAVSAMRSVGIPARQCYVPRWAHCDDNHAWVEIWVDGKWHYLGACEPEAVLDKGWFTAAASKAMLVHAKAYSNLFDGDDVAYKTPLYALINSTRTYGKVKTLRVRVLKEGKQKAGINVRFQLVNYSELFTMYEVKTDSEGYAKFETGIGDIYVYVEEEGRIVMQKMDARTQDELTLELTDGFYPEELKEDRIEEFDLIPPTEQVATKQSEKMKKDHKLRLAECEKIRSDYVNTFWQEKEPYNGKACGYTKEECAIIQKCLVHARGNWEEIEKFACMEKFCASDKAALLKTLKEKDYADITKEVLSSYLEASLPYKENYPFEIYRDYILAPRVLNEFLWDNRKAIKEQLKARKVSFQNGLEVYSYLKAHIALREEHGAGNWVADGAGMIENEAAGRSSFDILYVEVCRAFGIPARLNPVTHKPEYITVLDGQTVYHAADGNQEREDLKTDSNVQKKKVEKKKYEVILKNKVREPIQYEYRFTIARFVNGNYQTLQYDGMELIDQKELCLEEGSYRLLTTTRQLDGSISARAVYFSVMADRDLIVLTREDQTKQKLKSENLPDIMLKKEEKEVNLHSLIDGSPSVIVFAEPGKEPTEHLFQELLECSVQYQEKRYPIVIILFDEEGAKNPTLKKVLETFPLSGIWNLEDEDYISELHQIMKVGDERLPFVIAVDEHGKGRFAFANYNIRMAQTILKVLA